MLRVIAALALLLAANSAVSARPVRIVAFGDSNTAGWLVPRKEAYPAQLQALLRKKGYDVVVTNAGINGGTLLDALLHFDEAIAPDTDIAIVEFGTNDHHRHVSLSTIHRRLVELIGALHKRRIQILIIGAGGLDFSDIAKANGTLYAGWHLPPGKYRASDRAHYSAKGYAIVVAQMLPAVEALIARVKPR